MNKYRVVIPIIHLLILMINVLLSNRVQAQLSKPGINFQAVASDKNKSLAILKIVYVRTEIFPGDTLIGSSLIEEHRVQTDELGIFQVTIGKGVRVGGRYYSLYDIPWQSINYQVKVKISIQPSPLPSGWNYQDNWIDMGMAPLEIVPFALYALSSSGSLLLKSKNRSELLTQADSFQIQLATPLDLDDGISVLLETPRLPLPVPNYYIYRDIALQRIIIYFTAPYTGYVTWMILD